MTNRPTFYHAFFLLLFSVMIYSCGHQDDTEIILETTEVSQVSREVQGLLAKNTCLGCHRIDKKLIGPSYLEIAQRKYTKEELITLIKEPQPKNWPDYPPMAPMQWVNGEELATIADWIASLEVNE